MNPDDIPMCDYDPAKHYGIRVICLCSAALVGWRKSPPPTPAEMLRGRTTVDRPADARAAVAELLCRGWTYHSSAGWLCPDCSNSPDTPIFVVDPTP